MTKFGKTRIFILIIIMVFSGCATTPIVYESSTGMPAKNYEIYMTSPSRSEIKTIFHIVQNIETSRESYVPQYLDLYQEYKLDSTKTKDVNMVIRIYNPKKEKYRVIKVVESRPQWEWNFKKETIQIYNGNDVDKTFQLICPTEKGNYKVSATIVAEDDGLPIAMYPEFKYIMK